MGKLAVVITLVMFATALANPNLHKHLEAVKQINSLQNSWKAEITPLALLPDVERNKLLGAEIPSDLQNIRRRRVGVRNDIPSEFDARQQWSACPSIWAIKDQGHCGDCWAVSTASAASDRLCIITNYNTQLNLSAQNLMTCCTACSKKGGCNGGNTWEAWNYIENTGICTGGDYDSNEGCQPYGIVPTGLVRENIVTPPCENQCTNPNYGTPYDQDLHYGSSAYVLSSDVAQIQSDLLNNGPNVVSFTVYEDFYYVTTQVYHHVWGAKKGGHAVRLLGWGTDQESGEDYWLIANSWNRTHGDNGYYRIRRITNNCDFESYITGGLMSS